MILLRLALVFLFSITAFAYDELLIDAQSSLIPKIAVLDKDVQKKLVGGKLLIAVVHDQDDAEEAKEVVHKINTFAAQKGGAVAIKAFNVEFGQLQKSEESLIYTLRSNDANIKKAASIAKQKGIISFSYDRSDIANGIMLSLHFERNAVITLKRSVMKESGVQFPESFYKIVRIVE